MIKIGITGSLASGKSTASKMISKRKGLLFSADKTVKKLYKKTEVKKKILRIFNLSQTNNLKNVIKDKISNNKKILKKLENILHPLVRKEMFIFFKNNKNKKYIFCEIPLLIESKLTKYFDVIIFVKSKKKIRLKRYISKGGNPALFSFLDNLQLKDNKKMKFCDHIVVNNKSLSVLKKNLLNIMNLYE